jgi:hypothetical protein
LTIPATVASAERSFSKLKLVKNYVRSTMSPYGIIIIKGSLHHTIAKLEHYFIIAFSGAFLDFFSAKRVLTLSKTDFFLAISDSMLSLEIHLLINVPDHYN